MRKEFPRLLSEGTLGPLTLRNRIVMPAMDQNNCTEDGLISNKTLQHYEDRAKGGAGLLILETSAVKWPDGATSKHQPLSQVMKQYQDSKNLQNALISMVQESSSKLVITEEYLA